MVRKLRIRFTAASSLILLAVLSVIGVAINVMNYYNFIASTRETMSVIAANNGEFPDYEDYLQMLEEERAREELERNKGKDASFDEPDDEPEAETTAETSILEKFEYTAGFGFGLNVTAETAYETRYFYVRFTPDGGMLGYDLSHIAEVSMEEAESLGRNVLSQKSESGVYGNYRYYMHDTEGGAREIIFLNCATQLRSVNFVLFISIFTIIAVLATVTLSLTWIVPFLIVPKPILPTKSL